MYTEKRYPGKFEACESVKVAEVLSGILGNGFADLELGDVETFGYYALIRGKRYAFITEEDNFGFFTYVVGKPEDILKKWRLIEDKYDLFEMMKDDDDENV
jgi:hypothetical protein